MGTIVRVYAVGMALALSACGGDKRAAPPAPATSPDAARAKVDEYPDKDEYVPAEFKQGADRWRDTGIYVDGKFFGLLSWAELPLTLKPVWLKVKASAPKRYGTSDTGWRWAKERRYRFRDLVVSLGLEPTKVKEIHVYGPRFSESIVVTGKELASPAADEFYFRFGGTNRGKALPSAPEGLGRGGTPDKISSVMIYVEKAPPEYDRDVGFTLDGEVQTGVPYFGTPLRGGVRVYKDDRLVTYIKRQDLPADQANTTSGEPRWQLFSYLTAHGVDVADVVEAWVVRDEKWAEHIEAADLASMWFSAGAQAKGHIELGDQKWKTQALILRSHKVAAADVPALDPEEL
jgi:hypothetical protein